LNKKLNFASKKLKSAKPEFFLQGNFLGILEILIQTNKDVLVVFDLDVRIGNYHVIDVFRHFGLHFQLLKLLFLFFPIFPLRRFDLILEIRLVKHLTIRGLFDSLRSGLKSRVHRLSFGVHLMFFLIISFLMMEFFEDKFFFFFFF